MFPLIWTAYFSSFSSLWFEQNEPVGKMTVWNWLDLSLSLPRKPVSFLPPKQGRAPQLLFKTPETPWQNYLPLPRKGTAKENLQSFASSFCVSLPTKAFLHCANGVAAAAWKSLGLSPHPGVFNCIQPWHLYKHRQQKLSVWPVSRLCRAPCFWQLCSACLSFVHGHSARSGLAHEKTSCAVLLTWGLQACDDLEPLVPEDTRE